MRPYRLRADLERVVVNGYAHALGLVPGCVDAPFAGYTLDYVTADADYGSDDDGMDEGPEEDSYSFYVTISHERLSDLVAALMGLLGEEVYPIVEIGSRDAYRAVDVWMAQEPISRDHFLEGWARYEPFLLEDGSVSAGANSTDPDVEVFVDHWKGVTVHVPLMMRDQVEQVLARFDLHEVPESWVHSAGAERDDAMEVRQVLDLSEPDLPDVEELLVQLQEHWALELNVNPHANLDDAGRELGHTLWYALVVLEPRDDDGGEGCYGSAWVTAASLDEAMRLVEAGWDEDAQWRFVEVYTIDRVAFDERPDELSALTPRREAAEVHLVAVEPWEDGGAPGGLPADDADEDDDGDLGD